MKRAMGAIIAVSLFVSCASTDRKLEPVNKLNARAVVESQWPDVKNIIISDEHYSVMSMDDLERAVMHVQSLYLPPWPEQWDCDDRARDAANKMHKFFRNEFPDHGRRPYIIGEICYDAGDVNHVAACVYTEQGWVIVDYYEIPKIIGSPNIYPIKMLDKRQVDKARLGWTNAVDIEPLWIKF